MWGIGSSRSRSSAELQDRGDPTGSVESRLDRSGAARLFLGILWLGFFAVNAVLTFVWAGAETIPYHLIWVSYAFLYGLVAYSRAVTWIVFWVITLVTGAPLIWHAATDQLEWAECSEIVLMGIIIALLIWHVNRHRAAQARLLTIQEEERRQANNREMAARFGAHEMRTRLTIARGFAELIEESSGDGCISADAQLILDELDKATALATNLLTLVRVHQTGAWVPVEIDALIESAVHRWRSTADREWSVRSAVGVVVGDAERLEVVLDCLLENAVKFTGAGDRIAVDARRDARAAVLTVSDAGAGMPEADLDRVFEIFQTGSAAGDRAGCGLGLSVVKAIVDARGGTVSVGSQEGAGTCFTLTLPIEPVYRDGVARPASGRPVPGTGQKSAWSPAVLEHS